jgi:hypothetical protein
MMTQRPPPLPLKNRVIVRTGSAFPVNRIETQGGDTELTDIFPVNRAQNPIVTFVKETPNFSGTLAGFYLPST